MPELVLASSSRYRQQRLREAGIVFTACAANIDETPLADEHAGDLAMRLALEKANTVLKNTVNSLVIGCDQVAEVVVNGAPMLLGKPGNKANAAKQLALCNGNTVNFYTSLCIVGKEGQKPAEQLEKVEVQFRRLDEQVIDRYLDIDEPFDCAGSFKMERAGILLFESIHSRDPNALLGIPMMALVDALADLGHSVFEFC